MKIYSYTYGDVITEREVNGMYRVTLRQGTEVTDKILCDDYRMARSYQKAFANIARTRFRNRIIR